MKNLQQIVTEIKGCPVTMEEALKMAENNFGQIYAWVKADVVEKLLEEKMKNWQTKQSKIKTLSFIC